MRRFAATAMAVAMLGCAAAQQGDAQVMGLLSRFFLSVMPI